VAAGPRYGRFVDATLLLGGRTRIAGLAALILIAVVGTSVAAAGRRVHHSTRHHRVGSVVKIVSTTGDVDISTSPTASAGLVEAHSSWTGSRTPSRIVVSPDESTAHLFGRCDTWDHVHLWLFGARCKVGFRVVLPVRGSADVTLGVGDLLVSSLGGRLTARTSIGDVTADNLSTTRATVTVGTGDARLAFSVRPTTVKVSTSTGDVTVIVPAGHYQIRAGTSVGDVTIGNGIEQDGDIRHLIDLSAAVGDIRVMARG
jgi:hypothetical protein